MATTKVSIASEEVQYEEALTKRPDKEDSLPVSHLSPARSPQIVPPSVSPAQSIHVTDSSITAPLPVSARVPSLDAVVAEITGEPSEKSLTLAESIANTLTKTTQSCSSDKEVTLRHPDIQPTGFSSKLPEYRCSYTLSASDADLPHPRFSPTISAAGARRSEMNDVISASRELSEARRRSVVLAAKGVGNERSFAYFDQVDPTADLIADSAPDQIEMPREPQEDLSPLSIESSESPPGVVLAAAQQARRNRSRTVHHAGRENRQRISPAVRLNTKGVFGASLNALKRGQGGIAISSEGLGRGDRRVVEDWGHPAILEAATDHGKERDIGNGISPGEQSFIHPLMSHPPDPRVFIKRALTVPTRKKYTTFIPEPLDMRRSSRFMRETIVSTPYPERGSVPRPESPHSMELTEILLATPTTVNAAANKTRQPLSQSTLTVILYHCASRPPNMSTIIVPRTSRQLLGRSRRNQDSSAPKPWIITEYDDAALFHDIRAQYLWMRGVWISLLSARRVQSLRVVEYNIPSQLARNDDIDHSDKVLASLTDAFAEEKATKLYHNPGSGRGKTEWINWVNGLPGNANRKDIQTCNVAVQLNESWSAFKIGLAFASVSLASLLAALVWIFLGRDGESQVLQKGVS